MRVLVPADCVPLFVSEADRGLLPVPYRVCSEGLLARAARKVLSGSSRVAPPLPIDAADGAAARDCEAAWIASAIPPTAHLLDQLVALMPRVRKIYWQRTDLDGLVWDGARMRGIEIRTTGDLTSQWVAEANLACIAADCKRIGRRLQRDRGEPIPFVLEFDSVRVGIVGSGRIGQATASLCRSIGMRTAVLTRDPSRLAAGDHPYDEVLKLPSRLQDVVAEFDYLVLALPLNPLTKGLVSAEVMSAMTGTVLINLARPRLVDQSVMLRMLRSGKLPAAWVSRLEDLSVVDRLLAARTSNLFLTRNLEAHVASKQRNAFRQFVEFLAELD